MKKIIFLALSIFSFSNNFSQSTSAIFGEELVWYGLDFSNAKFVGGFDNMVKSSEKTETVLKNKFIPAWNTLILNEPAKYDLKKTFKKTVVSNYLTDVMNRNSKIDETKLMSWNAFAFENPGKVIESTVSKYTSGEVKSGVGVVFIVESFDKTAIMANVYVTFFDISSKSVLLTEKFSTVPMGIGVQNYWAGSVFKIFKQIEDKKMKEWKKKS